MRFELFKTSISLGFITLLSVALKISFCDSWKFWSVVRGVRRGGAERYHSMLYLSLSDQGRFYLYQRKVRKRIRKNLKTDLCMCFLIIM